VIEQNKLINTRFNYIKRIPQAVSQNFRSRKRKAEAFGFPDISKKSEEMERDRSNSEDPKEVKHLVKRLNNNNTIANISEF
jgi:hypothetical protein